MEKLKAGKRPCQAKTADGSGCQAAALPSSDFCFFHDPDRVHLSAYQHAAMDAVGRQFDPDDLFLTHRPWHFYQRCWNYRAVERRGCTGSVRVDRDFRGRLCIEIQAGLEL